MKSLNQRGMTGPVEIGLIAVFVIFVGFVAYRIGSARTDDTAANNAADSSEQEAAEIAKNEAEEDAAKEIDIPKDEEKKEEVTEDKPVEETIKKDPVTEETEDEDKKKDKIYISYLSSSIAQDATTVSVTAKLESRQTGTCYMKLYRDDQDKIIKEKRLEFQETCDAVFDKADIPVAGEWEFHTWFNGDDGKTEAYRAKDTLNITL